MGTNYSSGAERSVCNKFGILSGLSRQLVDPSDFMEYLRMRDFDWC